MILNSNLMAALHSSFKMDFLRFIYISLIFMTITGCKESYNMEDGLIPSKECPIFLRVLNNNYSCNSNENQFQFKIESFHTPWTITNIPEWIKLDSTNGSGSKSITCNIAMNPYGDHDRNAILFVDAANKSKNLHYEINIVQKSNYPYLKLGAYENTFRKEGGETNITIDTNCQWHSESQKNWIHTEDDYILNTLRIIVTPFEHPEGYKGMIYGEVFIMYSNKIEKISIYYFNDR